MNTHSFEILAPREINTRKRPWRRYSQEQQSAARRLVDKMPELPIPPVIDAEGTVVFGEEFVLAARAVGLEGIPVTRVHHVTPEMLRLYAIEVQKLIDMGTYDDALLAEELRELEQLLGSDSLKDLVIADGELTMLLGLNSLVDESSECSSIGGGPIITRPDDLWTMDEHRFLCSTALVAPNYERLLGTQRAQFGFTDPPFNLNMRTISSNSDREEFAFAHGEMSPNEYTRFLTTFMRFMQQWSDRGSLNAFFISYHYLLELLRAGTVVFGRPKAMCTWVKAQGGQGSLYRSQTEQIVFFKNGDAPHQNNVALGKHGRTRTTAWHYDGMTTASAERDELLKLHATPKPVQLLKDAILDVTKRGAIVLDPFAGIGSIAVAAHSAERRAYTIEIEPKFVDAAIRRMRAAYRLDAYRESDGASFTDLEAAALAGAGSK